MEASKDDRDEPAGKDLGVLLFLVAAFPFGLLSWVGLFFAVRWSILAVWSAAAGVTADPVIIPTTPAMSSHIVVPAAIPRSDPSASSLPVPHRLHLGTSG
jgi:hypothetical protein